MEAYTVQVDKEGTRCYYNSKDQLHREDGPAVENAGGSRFWFINDQLHREDGPAIEYQSGTQMWYRNGRLHREDGPAVESASGTRRWFFNGVNLSEAEFLAQTQCKEVTVAELEKMLGYKIKVVS